MSEPLPDSVSVLVIGAGVHGLSTAWHLAQQRPATSLVLDKTGVAAGASGIACGVIRNNYFQPAMSELMAACVEVWESDPEALHYHGSGYIALGPPARRATWPRCTSASSASATRPSCTSARRRSPTHMRSLYPDWRAPGLTVCLHERAGGYAFNRESMSGLAGKARAAGAEIRHRRRGDGLRVRRLGRRHRRAHDRRHDRRPSRWWSRSARGSLRCGRCSACPTGSTSASPTASVQRRPADVDLLVPPGGRDRVRPGEVRHRRRHASAVLHIDSDQPLRDDAGRLITDEPWGVYFKPDRDERPGRRRSRCRSATSSRSTRIRPAPSSPASPTCGARRCRTASGGSRARAPTLPPDPLGRRRRVHRRQLPGVRLHAPERVRRRRLEPRLQDDRRRPRDRPRARRRALLAAAPVPLRALRHRGPAPGLAQPVPLELISGPRLRAASVGPVPPGIHARAVRDATRPAGTDRPAARPHGRRRGGPVIRFATSPRIGGRKHHPEEDRSERSNQASVREALGRPPRLAPP